MLSAEKNRLLTDIEPGSRMGELLRRYWQPVAGASEFDERPTKPVRFFGEDLVLYRDRSGTFGLLERHCPHRRADLALGIVEACGLRCHYHGWQFDATGQCVHQPFEDFAFAERNLKAGIRAKAYPVQVHAGLVWAYFGPQPAPLLPDWEPFSRPEGFAQIVLAAVPCNWLQCQENSIDPVHFEWMHENWGGRGPGSPERPYGPRHTRLEFEEFEFGFVYKRIREDTDETSPLWTIGRTALWPNCFFLGEHFEWRVPIDNENTLSVVWKHSSVPLDRRPFVQGAIPAWTGPVTDAAGGWIVSHVMNQDFAAWAGQGRIADRTKEHLGASDRGIVMMRRRLFSELDVIAEGREPKGLIRDPARNVRVPLPAATQNSSFDGLTREQILADPKRRVRFETYIFQAGQPPAVRRAFEEAMGVEMREFEGLPAGQSGS